MKTSNTRNMILSGFFMAIGLLLPSIFHLIGGAGPIFLPMHIPVLIAGFFLPPFYAAFVGLLTPVLSSLLTGMPVLYPILPIMMGELMVYGLIVSWLGKKTNEKHLGPSDSCYDCRPTGRRFDRLPACHRIRSENESVDLSAGGYPNRAYQDWSSKFF